MGYYEVEPQWLTPDIYKTHAVSFCYCTYFGPKGTYALAVPFDGSQVYHMHCTKCGKDVGFVDLRENITLDTTTTE